VGNSSLHTESTFEQALVEHLTQNGWHGSNAKAFNCELAMDTASVLDFVQRTKADEKLTAVHGLAVEEHFISDW
jgi:hypothetical protein